MSSLLANTSALTALTALAALTPAEQNLNHVEDQASTGLAISTSAGKPAYWPVATKMTSNSGAHGAFSGTPGESQPLVSTMSPALNRTIPVMDAIKKELVTASQPGAGLNKIETDIAAQQQSLPSTGRPASFKGQKWLDKSGGNSNLVACRDSTSGVSVLTAGTTNSAAFNAPAGAANGIPGMAGASSGTSTLALNIAAAAGNLANMPADVETAIGSIPAAASTLGATTANLRTQWTYVSNPGDSLTTGAGSLVDANMNEAATKLAALEVQQQLGVQALSISHSNAQLILKLLEL